MIDSPISDSETEHGDNTIEEVPIHIIYGSYTSNKASEIAKQTVLNM